MFREQEQGKGRGSLLAKGEQDSCASPAEPQRMPPPGASRRNGGLPPRLNVGLPPPRSMLRGVARARCAGFYARVLSRRTVNDKTKKHKYTVLLLFYPTPCSMLVSISTQPRIFSTLNRGVGVGYSRTAETPLVLSLPVQVGSALFSYDQTKT